MNTNHFNNSRALLKNPFISGEAPCDQIFIVGAVTIDGAGRVVMAITEETPTVALNDTVQRKYGLDTNIVRTVEEIQKSDLASHWLISAGVDFWVMGDGQPQIILLQRDAKSKAAGQWFYPAGRVDRMPGISMDNEGHEELLLMFNHAGSAFYQPVIIDGVDYEGATPLDLKRNQIRANQAQLDAKGVTQEKIDASQAYRAPYYEMPHEQGLYSEVVLTVNGGQHDSFRAICLFDKDNHTLELLRSVVIKQGSGDSIVAVDGEGDKYNRKVQLFTVDQIREQHETGQFKARPPLAMYLNLIAPPIFG